MKVFRIIPLLLICIFACAKLQAQDLHFSQHVYNPLYYNPAFTGYIPEKVRLIGNYSDRYRQSLGSEGLQTVFGSADMNFSLSQGPVKNQFLGIGAYFYNHRRGAGSLNDNFAALSISYRIYFDRDQQHSLSAGFNISHWNRNFNYSNLQFGNQFDGMMYNPSIISGEQTVFPTLNRIDAGMGLVYT